jgi:hypothetical protein
MYFVIIFIIGGFLGFVFSKVKASFTRNILLVVVSFIGTYIFSKGMNFYTFNYTDATPPNDASMDLIGIIIVGCIISFSAYVVMKLLEFFVKRNKSNI